MQRETVGVFQQNPRWWKSANGGTAVQCMAFLADFAQNMKRHNGDPVHDCWITQQWELPGAEWPDIGPRYESERAREGSETHNYQRRVGAVASIISERRLP